MIRTLIHTIDQFLVAVTTEAVASGVVTKEWTKQHLAEVLDGARACVTKIEDLARQYPEPEYDADPALIDSMLHDKATTVAYLDHQDAPIRAAAIKILSRTWKVTKELKNKYVRLAREDADTHVRTLALFYLGYEYYGTGESTVRKLLIDIIGDESETRDIRLVAYMALFDLVGRPLYEMPALHLLRLPEDLDTKLLKS